MVVLGVMLGTPKGAQGAAALLRLSSGEQSILADRIWILCHLYGLFGQLVLDNIPSLSLQDQPPHSFCHTLN